MSLTNTKRTHCTAQEVCSHSDPLGSQLLFQVNDDLLRGSGRGSNYGGGCHLKTSE